MEIQSGKYSEQNVNQNKKIVWKIDSLFFKKVIGRFVKLQDFYKKIFRSRWEAVEKVNLVDGKKLIGYVKGLIFLKKS